jgi:hypothetical protein
MYLYGGPVDRVVDFAVRLARRIPLVAQALGKRYESHLEMYTPDPSTVIWVGLRDPAFATMRPAFLVPMRAQTADRQFQAWLIDADGKKTVLETRGGMQDGMHGCFVGAWSFPGSLEAHGGGTLQIELTNGVHLATFRLP